MVVLQQKKWAAVVRGHVVDTVVDGSPRFSIYANTSNEHMKKGDKVPMLKKAVPRLPATLRVLLMASRARPLAGTRSS